MNIYFLGSVTGGREFVKTYQEIIRLLEKQKHIVLSKQIADPNISIKGEKLSSKKIFEREKERILKSDLMIAEVTQPGLGVGYHILFALSNNIPVIALFNEESGKRPSAIIEGNPSPDLYFEYYNHSNLKSLLKRLLNFVQEKSKAKGKFIVIEGSDGSGKGTQFKLLIDYLTQNGKKIYPVDFPRYYSSFHGKMVGKYLNGDYGDVNDVNAYLVSLTYALDRASAKEDMYEHLAKGYYIIANRYTFSNMAYQSAKLPAKERKKFIQWDDTLEYKVHKIPREDITLFLYVPVEISQKLIDKKSKRNYTNKKKDIHERNVVYLKEVEKQYNYLCKKYRHVKKINCLNRKGNLKSIEEIHKIIIDILVKRKLF